MKKTIKSVIIITFCLSVIFSCKKENPIPATPLKTTETQQSSDFIILGKKLENPYSVTNMNIAFKNISSGANQRISASSPVKPTHLYIRFLPKDWKEYDELKANQNLKLYDYPLDYEIVTKGGRKYHDPSISADLPTWQYTAIPINYTVNLSIKKEILDELYLPELDSALIKDNKNLRLGTGVNEKSFVELLVNEAMALTNNHSDTINTQKGDVITFDPSGIVRVWDSRLERLIPLAGVKMRARRWFDIRETFTNNDGYYQIAGFKRDVNYALFYESNDFDVRSGTYGQAWIDGPKQSSPWNVDLYGVDEFYGHVFRGATRYFYGEVYGLRRPQHTTISRMKFAAYDKSGSVQGMCLGNWTALGTNPNIIIYRNDGRRNLYSDEIFGVTIHEISHATHIELMNAGLIQFLQVKPLIYESWATCVEWYITQKEYKNMGISNYSDIGYYVTNSSYPHISGNQTWRKGDPNHNDNYSSLFIDLIDNDNQNRLYFGTPVDNVTGYSLNSIESGFLKQVYGLGSLSDQLKNNKPSGVTNAQIDELLSNY